MKARRNVCLQLASRYYAPHRIHKRSACFYPFFPLLQLSLNIPSEALLLQRTAIGRPSYRTEADDFEKRERDTEEGDVEGDSERVRSDENSGESSSSVDGEEPADVADEEESRERLDSVPVAARLLPSAPRFRVQEGFDIPPHRGPSISHREVSHAFIANMGKRCDLCGEVLPEGEEYHARNFVHECRVTVLLRALTGRWGSPADIPARMESVLAEKSFSRIPSFDSTFPLGSLERLHNRRRRVGFLLYFLKQRGVLSSSLGLFNDDGSVGREGRFQTLETIGDAALKGMLHDRLDLMFPNEETPPVMENILFRLHNALQSNEILCAFYNFLNLDLLVGARLAACSGKAKGDTVEALIGELRVYLLGTIDRSMQHVGEVPLPLFIPVEGRVLRAIVAHTLNELLHLLVLWAVLMPLFHGKLFLQSKFRQLSPDDCRKLMRAIVDRKRQGYQSLRVPKFTSKYLDDIRKRTQRNCAEPPLLQFSHSQKLLVQYLRVIEKSVKLAHPRGSLPIKFMLQQRALLIPHVIRTVAPQQATGAFLGDILQPVENFCWPTESHIASDHTLDDRRVSRPPVALERPLSLSNVRCEVCLWPPLEANPLTTAHSSSQIVMQSQRVTAI